MRWASSIRLRGIRSRMKKARQQHGEDSGEKNTVEGSRVASGRTMELGRSGRTCAVEAQPTPFFWFFVSHPHGADQAFGWPPVRLVPGRAVGHPQTQHRYSGTNAFSYFAEPSASSVPCGLEVCLSASTCLCFPSLAKRPFDLQAERTSRGGPAAERRLWPRRRASSRAGAWPKTRSRSRSPLPSPARAREARRKELYCSKLRPVPCVVRNQTRRKTFRRYKKPASAIANTSPNTCVTKSPAPCVTAWLSKLAKSLPKKRATNDAKPSTSLIT
jgi:hypothetical protein